jgi:hypothetical protein
LIEIKMFSRHFLLVFVAWVMALLITGPFYEITKDKVSPRAFRIASRAFRIVFATIVGSALDYYVVMHSLTGFFGLTFILFAPLTAIMALVVGVFEWCRWMVLGWLMMLRRQENDAKTRQATEVSANPSTSEDTSGSGAMERTVLERRVLPFTELFLSIALAMSFFVFLKLSQALELFPEYHIDPDMYKRTPFKVVSIDSGRKIHALHYVQYRRHLEDRKLGMSLNVPETGNDFKKVAIEMPPFVVGIFYYKAKRNAEGMLEVRYKNDRECSSYTLKDGDLIQASYGNVLDSTFSGAALWLAFCWVVRWRYDRWKQSVLDGVCLQNQSLSVSTA